jgi:ATP-dependent helicase/DNAse subunit B
MTVTSFATPIIQDFQPGNKSVQDLETAFPNIYLSIREGSSLFKTTAILGELKNHREILLRIRAAITERDFTLTIVFPTISLLHAIEDELLADSEVSGIGGVRFFLFEGFLNDVCERLGVETSRPSLLQEELLLTTAFRQLTGSGKLDYLNRAPFNAHYRRAVLEGFREWQRAGLTAEHFRKWAVERGPQPRQLSLLYQTYVMLLNKHGFQTESQICQQLQEIQVKTLPSARPEQVLFYGYTDLTPLQADFLTALQIKLAIEFLIDPTLVPEFREFSAKHFPHSKTTESPISKTQGLVGLQQRLWLGVAWEEERLPLEDGSLQIIRAAGISGEVRAVLRQVAQLLQEDPGCRLEDFLILTPNPPAFLKAAAPVCSEYGLPLKENATTVREYPIVYHYFDSLKAVADGWQWSNISRLIPSFYQNADLAAGDAILVLLGEKYGAVTGRERWLQFARDDGFIKCCTQAGLDLEPLFTGLNRLAGIPEQAEFSCYLAGAEEWFAAASANSTVWRDFSLRRTAERNAVNIMTKTLQELRGFWGEQTGTEFIPVEAFQAFCLDYLADLEISPFHSAAPTLRVLSPREARGLKARFVFITGLNEGEFPRPYISDWKLPLPDRFELNQLGFLLETGILHRLQEKLAFYWSIQAAQERLYLVGMNQNSDGTPLNASIYLEELLERIELPAEFQHTLSLAPRLPRRTEDCFSDSELRARLAFLWNQPDLEDAERREMEMFISATPFRNLARRLYRWHNLRLPLVQALESPAFHQELALRYGPQHCFAVTLLENYRRCPYRFYQQHLLMVKPLHRPESLPERLEIGGVYHRVYQEFGTTLRGQRLQPERRAEYIKKLQAGFTRYFEEYLGNAANPLDRIMLELEQERVRRNLARWLDAELDWDEATGGRFRFTYQEFSFGDTGAGDGPESIGTPYRLENGAEIILLRGRADRVDTTVDGTFIVYDYKTGQVPAKKDLEGFGVLQIPAYILALEALLPGGFRAVGGVYLGAMEPSRRSGSVWNTNRLGFRSGSSSKDELAWQEWLAAAQEVLKETVAAIRAGRFFEKPHKCLKYCEYKYGCPNLVLGEVIADDGDEVE